MFDSKWTGYLVLSFLVAVSVTSELRAELDQHDHSGGDYAPSSDSSGKYDEGLSGAAIRDLQKKLEKHPDAVEAFSELPAPQAYALRLDGVLSEIQAGILDMNRFRKEMNLPLPENVSASSPKQLATYSEVALRAFLDSCWEGRRKAQNVNAPYSCRFPWLQHPPRTLGDQALLLDKMAGFNAFFSEYRKALWLRKKTGYDFQKLNGPGGADAFKAIKNEAAAAMKQHWETPLEGKPEGWYYRSHWLVQHHPDEHHLFKIDDGLGLKLSVSGKEELQARQDMWENLSANRIEAYARLVTEGFAKSKSSVPLANSVTPSPGGAGGFGDIRAAVEAFGSGQSEDQFRGSLRDRLNELHGELP